MKRVEEYKNKLKQKLRVEQVVELSSNFVQQYGSTGASYSHNMAPNQVLTNKQKKAFMRDGYLVLRGAVPQEMVEAALKAVDEAFENGQYEIEADKADPVPHFNVEARKHEDIAHIPRQTDVFAACEDLMGKNKAHYGPKGQIAFRQTDLKMIQSGMTMTEAMPAHRYHIDGGHGVLGPTGTPFSLLVGICLSDGQDIDENRGQFNVWPGKFLKCCFILFFGLDASLSWLLCCRLLILFILFFLVDMSWHDGFN